MPGPASRWKGKDKEKGKDDREDEESESEISVGQVKFVRKGCPRCLEREQLEKKPVLVVTASKSKQPLDFSQSSGFVL